MSLELLYLAIPSAVCLAITEIRRRYHVRKGARIDAATSLSGVVLAESSGAVLELVLDLKIPHSQSGMSVEETHRELHGRSFTLKTDDGELIDVEPPRDMQLHAPLGRAQKIELLRRYKKVAQVRAGERVYLAGQVQELASPEGGPFREGEHAHRRIAPAVVSTEKLGATARRAAAIDRTWLKRWGVMTLLGPLPWVVPIVPLFVFGFWIRDMFVARVWWEQKRYKEWYGSGTTREDRAEYH